MYPCTHPYTRGAMSRDAMDNTRDCGGMATVLAEPRRTGYIARGALRSCGLIRDMPEASPLVKRIMCQCPRIVGRHLRGKKCPAAASSMAATNHLPEAGLVLFCPPRPTSSRW